MTAAQYQRHRGLFHPGNQLRNGKPRLDIPADRVEEQQQPVNFLAFLHGREQGNDVLIFCRLDVLRQRLMALDLSNDRQRVDLPPRRIIKKKTKIDQLLPRLFFLLCFTHIHVLLSV